MLDPEAQSAARSYAQFAVVRSTQTILWRTLAVIFVGNALGGLLVMALGIQNVFLALFLDSVMVSVLCLPGLFRAILRPATELAREQAVAGAEARFQAIAQAVNDGILIFDANKNIQFANHAAEQMHGYPPGSLIGVNMESLVPEDEKERFRAAMAQRLDAAQGSIRGEGLREVTGLRRQGESFPLEVRVNALQEHESVTFVVVLREITARKQAEASLRKSEELFRMLADTAPVMIWTSNAKGDCTFASKVWLDFRGRTLDQELGYGWAEGIHPDDREQAVRLYHAALAERREFENEFRMRRADGEYRWMLSRARPRFTPEDEYLGFVGSTLDVTVRKQMEDALRASERRIREMLEAMPVALRIVQDNRLVFANPADARLHGFDSVDQEVALAPHSQIAPDDLARVEEFTRRRAAGEPAPKRYEIKTLRRNGEEFPVEVEVEQILYNGAPASLIALRDLTESKRIEIYEKLLPVCCVCGKIRDDAGTQPGAGAWERLDQYLSKHTDTQFSHTFCPICFEDYKKQNLHR